MELRHVAAFLAVAEELHFGRAADRLGIAQPALSRLVRRLEGELGVLLFERSSHAVALTAAGEELLGPARTLLRAADRLTVAAEHIATGTKGSLRLGTTEGMGARLGVLLRAMAALRPQVEVELFPAHTPEKLELLRRGELDLAVVREPGPAPGLMLEPLWEDPLVAVLPGRLSAAPQAADLEHLELPLLLTPRHLSPGVHDALRAAAGPAGARTQEYRALPEALALVGAGRAWTILAPENVPLSPELAVCPLPARATISAMLAWRALPSSPHVTTFVTAALAARDAGKLDGGVRSGEGASQARAASALTWRSSGPG